MSSTAPVDDSAETDIESLSLTQAQDLLRQQIAEVKALKERLNTAEDTVRSYEAEAQDELWKAVNRVCFTQGIKNPFTNMSALLNKCTNCDLLRSENQQLRQHIDQLSAACQRNPACPQCALTDSQHREQQAQLQVHMEQASKRYDQMEEDLAKVKRELEGSNKQNASLSSVIAKSNDEVTKMKRQWDNMTATTSCSTCKVYEYQRDKAVNDLEEVRKKAQERVNELQTRHTIISNEATKSFNQHAELLKENEVMKKQFFNRLGDMNQPRGGFQGNGLFRNNFNNNNNNQYGNQNNYNNNNGNQNGNNNGNRNNNNNNGNGNRGGKNKRRISQI